ncbi:hypothetical protein QLQ97_30435, partial [Burkholderia pseudomallei]|nr:hypothetical protein [Burkholderia pseudomallei]
MRRGRRTIAGPRERRRIGNGRHAKARMHAQASLFCGSSQKTVEPWRTIAYNLTPDFMDVR